jgi:two-component system, OmpR family, response regulator ChvI
LSQPRPQGFIDSQTRVSQKKRILVVDDEVDITTVFKLGLEEADLQVDACTDPVLALSEYKPDMYDLLLFDIKMPKMDGFELYEKIKDIEVEKKKDRNKKTAICFITAHEDYRSQFKNSFQTLEEEDCFLKKPILLPDLVKSVKTRLGL